MLRLLLQIRGIIVMFVLDILNDQIIMYEGKYLHCR